MEEKLDLIIQKLDELLYLAKRIHKDTEPSTESNASEYLLNVLGDVTGDILMQGFTSGYYGKNYLMELKHEQSSFMESVIYHYKDTHPMVTGLIHW